MILRWQRRRMAARGAGAGGRDGSRHQPQKFRGINSNLRQIGLLGDKRLHRRMTARGLYQPEDRSVHPQIVDADQRSQSQILIAKQRRYLASIVRIGREPVVRLPARIAEDAHEKLGCTARGTCCRVEHADVGQGDENVPNQKGTCLLHITAQGPHHRPPRHLKRQQLQFLKHGAQLRCEGWFDGILIAVLDDKTAKKRTKHVHCKRLFHDRVNLPQAEAAQLGSPRAQLLQKHLLLLLTRVATR
eukprot:2081914-Prymnesium_polylepis.1